MVRRRAPGPGRRAGGRAPRLGRLALLLVLAAPRPAAVDVFFVRYDPATHAGTLVRVRRAAGSGGTSALLRFALRDLIAGPTPEEQRRGITSEIPRGTALRSVRIQGGVATVDLTAPFASGGGSTSMQARLWQVVYTGTQFRQASEVQILLDGPLVPAPGGEGLMIGAPLRRPASPPTF